MKIRALSLLLAIALCLVLAPTSFASTDSGDVIIEQYDEIKDLKELFERAQKGETDLKTEKIKSIVKNSETGAEAKVETYDTTQLLKVTKDKNGNIKKDYKTITFALVYLPEEESTDTNNGEISIMGADIGDPKTDPTYSVKTWATRYYTTDDVQGFEHILITGASGGWQILDGTVSIRNKMVRMACNGAWGGDTSRHNVTKQLVDKSTSGYTFNYQTGFTEYVNRTWDRSAGCGLFCEIVRGGSVWTWFHKHAEGSMSSPT